MKPKFTDRRGRYYTAEQSRAPGYLERRFKAMRRLQRMKARQAECNVEQFPQRRSQR